MVRSDLLRPFKMSQQSATQSDAFLLNLSLNKSHPGYVSPLPSNRCLSKNYEIIERSTKDIFCFQDPLIPEMLLFFISIPLFFKAESM